MQRVFTKANLTPTAQPAGYPENKSASHLKQTAFHPTSQTSALPVIQPPGLPPGLPPTSPTSHPVTQPNSHQSLSLASNPPSQSNPSQPDILSPPPNYPASSRAIDSHPANRPCTSHPDTQQPIQPTCTSCPVTPTARPPDHLRQKTTEPTSAAQRLGQQPIQPRDHNWPTNRPAQLQECSHPTSQ